MKSEQIIKFIDSSMKWLLWTSIITYLIEEQLGAENSREGHWGFLWTERVIAGVLTVECLVRAFRGKLDYLKSPLGIIDLIGIFPFWAGFFVPPSWLNMVRTLRILRLLKFFRYSRSMQLTALAFYRAAGQLKPLVFSMLIIALFSSAAVYQAERYAQPDDFNSLFNTMWFTAVTVTTVGYGDISPVTPIGKCVTLIIFGVGLVVFAGIVGVLGNSFSEVLEEEMDPNIDPVEKFAEERVKNRLRKHMDKEFSQA